MSIIFDRRQMARNLFSSWVAYAVRMAIAFLFVPYITGVLGDARYGVWVIVLQAITYFNLFDFGLERALQRFIPKYLSSEDYTGVNRIVNTTWLIYLGLGTIIIGGVYLAATFLFDYFRIADPVMLEQGRQALIIMGVYAGFRFYLLPFAGSLGGFQRYDAHYAFQIAEEIVRVLVLVWLLASGYGLPGLATGILGVSLLRQFVSVIWLRSKFPGVTFRPTSADKGTARSLFGYSKITFAITVGWLIIYNSDAILLGLLGSASAVGVYQPGAQLILHFRNLANSVAGPITSAIAHWESTREIETIRRVYLKGLKYTSFAACFIGTGIVLYAQPFVDLWLQPEFAAAGRVMMILAVGTAVFVPQIIGNAVLFGIDRHRVILGVLVIEASAKIILSLFLIEQYGVIGMALAAAIPQFILYTSMYPYLIAQVLQLPFGRLLRLGSLMGLFGVLATAPVGIILKQLLPPNTWGTFAANIGLTGLVALAIGLLFVLEAVDRDRVRRYILSLGGLRDR